MAVILAFLSFHKYLHLMKAYQQFQGGPEIQSHASEVHRRLQVYLPVGKLLGSVAYEGILDEKGIKKSNYTSHFAR